MACKLTSNASWLLIYNDEPSINWYACSVENIKAIRLKLKVISYGVGGLPEFKSFLSNISASEQYIFAVLLINEANHHQHYKLINIMYLSTKLRLMYKVKISAQMDSIMEQFPVRHLSLKLDETKLYVLSENNITTKLNKYRGPYKVEYNFITKTFRNRKLGDIHRNKHDEQHALRQLIKENERLQSKISELELKLTHKQQEMDLLIQHQQNIQFINGDDDHKEPHDFCVESFHLFMDAINIKEIKQIFLQNPKYNDIRMMVYLDQDIMENEIGIHSKIFIKMILNESKTLIESQQEFADIIRNKRYTQLLYNKGILTLTQFEMFIKTEKHLKHAIDITNSKDIHTIWNRILKSDALGELEGQQTIYQ